MKKKALVCVLLATAIIGGLVWRSPFISSEEAKQKSESSLPSVGTYGNFVSMMKKLQKEISRRNYALKEQATTATESSAPASGDFSTTNVQVQGVDEADRVKTDGKYIYQLKAQKLVVTEAYPSRNMSIIWTKDFASEGIYPNEMYVDEKNVTIIGTFNEPKTNEQMTKIRVYDVNDKKDIKLSREIDVEGLYLSSRKIENSLYVVSNQYIFGFEHLDSNNADQEHFYAPAYCDSASTDGVEPIPWDKIKYIPDFQEPNFLIVTGLNLSDTTKEVSVSAYLGAGSTIYASSEHLYVSTTNYEQNSGIMSEAQELVRIWERPRSKSTSIFKFKLKDAAVEFASQGKVEGSLLNQFSIDEHEGYLRVATTTGEVWGRDAEQSKNHLFVLDENLKPTAEVRDIAPGERIYSVRFMGDRGYMVTFKKVDPLFVFDLADPKNPTILGKLKIPGYSDYLHPYDENHIIGFGKDTVEAQKGDFAYYQGLKMALFDITDVNNPKEKFTEIIGDRGTESEMLTNHKALLFSKDKNIIAFPVTVAKLPEGTDNPEGNAYGEYSFQGAIVYGLDLENGFILRNKITHMSDEDMKKAGSSPHDAKKVRRALYIGKTLYTISDYKIEAHHMESFKKEGEIILP